MSRTVYLHVGIAKTGTTYLQRTLFANRVLLEKNGTRFPGPDPGAHFFGSLDLRGVTFKGHVYNRVEGAWARLVAQADGFDGDTLISHETLAHAKPNRIQRAVSSFATNDVRVLITGRDLARQIPAVWQETLKNREDTPYAEFLTRIFADWRDAAGRETGFWGAQDLGGVAERWAAAVGADKVYVVTVPPKGADRSELWNRFARAANLPDIDYTFPKSDNSSLGVGEAELLRRVNPLLPDSLEWPQYDARIKKRLAEHILGPLDTQGRLTLPVRWRPEVAAITAAEVAALTGLGVTVVGDLQELDPEPEVAAARQPEDLTDSELLETALQVVSVLAARPPRPAPVNRRTVRSLLTLRSARRAGQVARDAVGRRLRPSK